MFLTKDIPVGSIAGGNPCKVIWKINQSILKRKFRV